MESSIYYDWFTAEKNGLTYYYSEYVVCLGKVVSTNWHFLAMNCGVDGQVWVHINGKKKAIENFIASVQNIGLNVVEQMTLFQPNAVELTFKISATPSQQNRSSC